MRLVTTALLLLLASPLFFFSCTLNQEKKQEVDAIYHNGKVYTVDSSFSIKEAFVIKDGKFVEVGSSKSILEKYTAKEIVDLNKKPVYPGFYDAHCHFVGYAKSLGQVNLVGTGSFDDVISKVIEFRKQFPDQPWVTGRGWDQNDWEIKEFPNNDTLNKLFPDIPVLLRRIDGHGAIANEKALQLANIESSTQIEGGMIEVKNNQLTGILVDNAVDLVLDVIPEPETAILVKLLKLAEQNCRDVGLTTVSDAGLDLWEIMLIDSLQKSGELDINMYAMLNPGTDEFEFAEQKGHYITDKLTVRSFKVYGDGALGSRGACLKKPYTDKKDHTGFLLSPIDTLDNYARKINDLVFQMNTHCIGDSANKVLLDIYSKYLKPGNDQRWRIEHGQVVDSIDLHYFKDYNIIPSIQPTHCTSDMYWAEERLGAKRVRNAYAYRSLLNERGMVANGSDFPIESINPLFGFYAAVSRKDQNDFPASGYYLEEALTREQALKAMTVWAAYASFEEDTKGSIEAGKKAQFVILDQDIMTCPEEVIWKTEVVESFLF